VDLGRDGHLTSKGSYDNEKTELSSASLRNWNDGIMERWNNGFGGLGKWFTRLNRVPSGKFNRVNWENQLDKEGNKYETSAKDIHSSSFQYARGARVPSGQKNHHSIIPWVRQKITASKNLFIFNKLYNFRDV